MLRLLNFLTSTRRNWHSCGTLCTLFVKPCLMKNNQQESRIEAWKYFINSWNSCLMYGWFCNVIFLSFDTFHRPAIWHSTIGGGGISLIHPSASNMTSACNDSKTKNYGKMSLLRENVITGFSTINRAITYKLESHNYSFII